MLKKDVQNGLVYEARIGQHLRAVQLLEARKDRYSGRTHWRGLNLETDREVTIRSAAKLRREINPDHLSPRAYGRMR